MENQWDISNDREKEIEDDVDDADDAEDFKGHLEKNISV